MEAIIDIETDGLLRELTKLHVLSWYVQGSVEPGVSRESTANVGLAVLASASVLVGHNIIGFDLPALKKLFPDWKPCGKIRDTLLYSQLLYPDMLDHDAEQDKKKGGKWIPKHLWGSHALEAWGYRLGEYKGDFKGPWDTWTQDMEDYCVQDVRVTTKLWERLSREAAERLTEEAIAMEHKLAYIMGLQEQHGFLFDEDKARKLTGTLMARREELTTELRSKFFPPIYKAGHEFVPSRDNKTLGYLKGVPFCKVELIEFNPGSRQQIASRLQKQYGWEPKAFTDPTEKFPDGQPEVSEDILSLLSYDCCPLLNEYLMVEKRIGFLAEGQNALLKKAEADGRIHGRVNTAGTVTRRCSHSSPNIAQTPAKGVPYWSDIRSLFFVPKGKKLVGCDADGLEARIMGHFMHPYDKGAFAWAVLNGKKEDGSDVHSVNQRLLEYRSRDNAKTWLYACVPMDTTALTRRGWKAFEDLVIGEDIMTYNSDLRIKEWKPILEKIWYPDAELVEMSHSKGFVFRSTPDHRWYVKQRTGRRAKYMVDEVRCTRDITTESNIIMNAPFIGDAESSYQFVYDKWGTTWVDKVLSMDSAERRAFLQGFILADGYQNPNGNLSWSQNESEIAEAALLATYLEHPGKLHVIRRTDTPSPMIRVLLSSKGHTTGQTLKKVQVPNAPVWCVRTANSSFVARQGYVITITGNCIYGAGDEKLGRISLEDMGPEAKATFTKEDDIKWIGRESREKLMKGLPALKELTDDIKRVAKARGWLKALDGARLQVRSDHAAPNTLFQSAGALAMKVATIILYEKCLDKGWEFGKEWAFVAFVHDEWQIEVDEDKAEEMGKMACDAIREAGEHFNLLCPLAGNYKIGDNWSFTH